MENLDNRHFTKLDLDANLQLNVPVLTSITYVTAGVRGIGVSDFINTYVMVAVYYSITGPPSLLSSISSYTINGSTRIDMF